MKYRIKPLKWEYEEYDPEDIIDAREKEWLAFTRLGHFRITKTFGIDDLYVCRDFGGTDYHYYSSNSVEEAKELCEKVWKEEIEKCLIKVNTDEVA